MTALANLRSVVHNPQRHNQGLRSAFNHGSEGRGQRLGNLWFATAPHDRTIPWLPTNHHRNQPSHSVVRLVCGHLNLNQTYFGRNRWADTTVRSRGLSAVLGEGLVVEIEGFAGGHPGFWNRLTPLHQKLDVKRKCFLDHLQHFVPSLAGTDTSRNFRRVRGIVVRGLFNHDCVRKFHCTFPRRPACFWLPFQVPLASHPAGWPSIVTVPSLCGWQNCRWLPHVLTWYQPSPSTSRLASLSFGITETYRFEPRTHPRTGVVRHLATLQGVQNPL